MVHIVGFGSSLSDAWRAASRPSSEPMTRPGAWVALFVRTSLDDPDR